jgi:PAS domain-containing protein
MTGMAAEAAIAMDNAQLFRSAQREIEERRQAEAALLETEVALREAGERVELALEAGAIVGTWVWDIQADRFTGDDRFARTFSLSRTVSKGSAIKDC